jgi:hypothetical protein
MSSTIISHQKNYDYISYNLRYPLGITENFKSGLKIIFEVTGGDIGKVIVTTFLIKVLAFAFHLTFVHFL